MKWREIRAKHCDYSLYGTGYTLGLYRQYRKHVHDTVQLHSVSTLQSTLQSTDYSTLVQSTAYTTGYTIDYTL